LLSIGPEVDLIKHEDVDQSVAATTKLFTQYLEDAIRAYPDQWNWLGFHRNGRMGRPVRRRRKKRARALSAPGQPRV
jgi:hypothetical protein